jgi:hypothetical protein
MLQLSKDLRKTDLRVVQLCIYSTDVISMNNNRYDARKQYNCVPLTYTHNVTSVIIAFPFNVNAKYTCTRIVYFSRSDRSYKIITVIRTKPIKSQFKAVCLLYLFTFFFFLSNIFLIRIYYTVPSYCYGKWLPPN